MPPSLTCSPKPALWQPCRHCSMSSVPPLLTACLNGDHNALRSLLFDSTIVNQAVDSHERTPLLIACRDGHVECARLLLEGGASSRSSSVWHLMCA